MEVDTYLHYPESNFEYLANQVETDSEFCDLMVKKGVWEKKFHRCVLAASPFFDIIATSQFVKNQSDIVEINLDATPEALEMAIMFLYGREPDFDIENVKDILELAEFFMIKDLKLACIDWLDFQMFDEIDCMYLIQLATKYNFELPNCIKYIEGNIPEIFQNKDSVQLMGDSVGYLLTERRFSYVTMDDKLTFLLKWVSVNPNTAADYVSDLFKAINVQDVSSAVWENAKCSVPFNELIDLSNVVPLMTDKRTKIDTLILTCDKDHFACLDLNSDQWYRINSNIFDSMVDSELNFDIAGIRNSSPEIYFPDTDGWGVPTIQCLSLETDASKTYNLNFHEEYLSDGELYEEEMENISLKDDKVVATVDKTFQFYEDSSNFDDQEIRDTSSSTSSLDSNQEEATKPNDEANSSVNQCSCFDSSSISAAEIYNQEAMTPSTSKKRRNNIVKFTEVQLGNVSDHTVQLSPLFSLWKDAVLKACLNKQSVIALLTKCKKKVLLFDLTLYKMDEIEITPDENYDLVQTDKGFIIYNDHHCYCVTRLEVPFFAKNYTVEEYRFELRENHLFKYRFCNGIWIRIVHIIKEGDDKLQYASHEELTINEKSPLDINWNKLSMPEETEIKNKLLNTKNLIIVSLPRAKLRCDIACPHCIYYHDEI